MKNSKDFHLPLLLFDSECAMCTRFKMALERLPGSDQINMVSIHEKEIYEKFTFLDPKDCHDTVHLIDESEKLHKGPEVVEYLVTIIPGIKKISWLVQTDTGKKALEFFYDTVNKYRKSKLNRCPSCK